MAPFLLSMAFGRRPGSLEIASLSPASGGVGFFSRNEKKLLTEEAGKHNFHLRRLSQPGLEKAGTKFFQGSEKKLLTAPRKRFIRTNAARNGDGR